MGGIKTNDILPSHSQRGHFRLLPYQPLYIVSFYHAGRQFLNGLIDVLKVIAFSYHGISYPFVCAHGGLFFALCENVQDMELSDALRSLMSLFMETINGYGTEDTETIKSKVTNWIANQSGYIKGLFTNLCLES